MKEQHLQFMDELNNVSLPKRAVTLYHEGFTVPEIRNIIGVDALTIAYWIEEYA
jgi:hypothetical protein